MRWRRACSCSCMHACMHGRSCMAIEPRIPTTPRRGTSGFHVFTDKTGIACTKCEAPRGARRVESRMSCILRTACEASVLACGSQHYFDLFSGKANGGGRMHATSVHALRSCATNNRFVFRIPPCKFRAGRLSSLTQQAFGYLCCIETSFDDEIFYFADMNRYVNHDAPRCIYNVVPTQRSCAAGSP